MTQPIQFLPVRTPFVGTGGTLTRPAEAFLRLIYDRIGGTAGESATQVLTWMPTFSGLTVSGTATYSGYAVQVGEMVIFRALINPGSGSTVANDGGAQITNLPRGASSGWYCTAGDFVIASYGHGRIIGDCANLPKWTANPAAVSVSGVYRIA